MDTCIFCKIANQQIPTEFLYEDEDFVVFKDIKPESKIHWLVVPKAHYSNVLELTQSEAGQKVFLEIGKSLEKIVSKADMDKNGFRLLTNCGTHGAQSVDHVHFHILGGEQLKAKIN